MLHMKVVGGIRRGRVYEIYKEIDGTYTTDYPYTKYGDLVITRYHEGYEYKVYKNKADCRYTAICLGLKYASGQPLIANKYANLSNAERQIKSYINAQLS